MSRAKRRQKSTQIRKRIEKKQREEDRARKREQKGQQQASDLVLRMVVERGAAAASLGQLRDLEARLAGGPIRGWTTADLQSENGLSELADLMGAALDRQPPAPEGKEDRLVVELTVAARAPLLERLSALEMAAPGLKVEWDSGFPEVTRALGHATEELPEEPDEPEGEGEDAEGAGEESGAGEVASGEGEVASGEGVVATGDD